MRPDLLEGVRTLRWSGLHPSHASGITDTLNETRARCPASLDLVRPHLADLRRARSAETPFSGSSHFIWSARAILSVASHSIWPTA